MFRLTTLAASLCFLAVAQAAVAQEDPTTRSANQGPTPAQTRNTPTVPNDASVPMSRMQVKAEARAAEQSGEIARGQAATPIVASAQAPLPVDRAQVKQDAAKAEAHREPIYGLTSQWNQMNAGKSTANRAAIKQDTRIAERNNEIPRGEASSMPAASPTAD